MSALSEPLTAAQLRILGVLVEKQLATPQAYPLTENALLTGCNQSTNREPVVAYDSAVLRPAMIQLRALGLARRVKRIGERVEKHAHRLDEQLGLSSPVPLAILAMLMLRGAQTTAELRARTQRLIPDPDADPGPADDATDDATDHAPENHDSFEAALTELRDRGLAHLLPRAPGEKQQRWQHLLGDPDAHDGPTADGAPAAGDRPGLRGADAASSGSTSHAPSAGGATAPPPVPVPTNRELAAAVEHLQRRVAHLERELGLDEG